MHEGLNRLVTMTADLFHFPQAGKNIPWMQHLDISVASILTSSRHNVQVASVLTSSRRSVQVPTILPSNYQNVQVSSILPSDHQNVQVPSIFPSNLQNVRVSHVLTSDHQSVPVPSTVTSDYQKPLRHSIDSILQNTISAPSLCCVNSMKHPDFLLTPTISLAMQPPADPSLGPHSFHVTSVNGFNKMSHGAANNKDRKQIIRVTENHSQKTHNPQVRVKVTSKIGRKNLRSFPNYSDGQKTLQRKVEASPVLSTPYKSTSDSVCPSANLFASVSEESRENVKSAFRPIVRPWLTGDEVRKPQHTSINLSSQTRSCLKASQVNAPLRITRHFNPRLSELTSPDAITSLRRQSFAFCMARKGTKQDGGLQSLLSNFPGPRAVIDNCNDTGLKQPLPPNFATLFSWLRRSDNQLQNPVQSAHHPMGLQVLVPTSCISSQSQAAPRYNCEACGKSYSTFGGLSKHKQFHCAAQVKKDFRCKFCDKSYSSLGALKMHIRTHTLPCKCSVCGKAFSRPWLLQGHVRTHTGEKPFSCPHCARAFADRSNLRAHLQTHTQVKKYSCRACSKTFSRMSLLAKHRESNCAPNQR